MAERKYSVSEIDEMRQLVRDLHTVGSEWWGEVGGSRSRTVTPPKNVEELLRTYMLNGTDADELRRAIAARDKADEESFRQRCAKIEN